MFGYEGKNYIKLNIIGISSAKKKQRKNRLLVQSRISEPNIYIIKKNTAWNGPEIVNFNIYIKVPVNISLVLFLFQ